MTGSIKIKQLESDYALLDVRRGRGKLAKRVSSKAADIKRVPVTIKGYINRVFGHDDGYSQEFKIEVHDD